MFRYLSIVGIFAVVFADDLPGCGKAGITNFTTCFGQNGSPMEACFSKCNENAAPSGPRGNVGRPGQAALKKADQIASMECLANVGKDAIHQLVACAQKDIKDFPTEEELMQFFYETFSKLQFGPPCPQAEDCFRNLAATGDMKTKLFTCSQKATGCSLPGTLKVVCQCKDNVMTELEAKFKACTNGGPSVLDQFIGTFNQLCSKANSIGGAKP